MEFTSDSELWDVVLTHVESDVHRTETLLADIASPAADLQVADPHYPLLGLDAVGPLLPELSAMPAIPREMLGRIVALRQRIDQLRLEVEVEMLRCRDAAGPFDTAAARSLRGGTPEFATPRFVDRRF